MNIFVRLWRKLLGLPDALDPEQADRELRDAELIAQTIAQQNAHRQQMAETRRAEARRHRDGIVKRNDGGWFTVPVSDESSHSCGHDHSEHGGSD